MKKLIALFAILSISSVFAYTETLETCVVKGELQYPDSPINITELKLVDADNNLMFETVPAASKILYGIKKVTLTKADKEFSYKLRSLYSALGNFDLHTTEKITTHSYSTDTEILSLIKLTDINNQTIALAVRLTNDETYDVKLACK